MVHQADSFAQIREPRLLRLAEYWMSRRGERRMPRRSDIDPLDIPWALSRIYIVDRVAPPTSWRYRLAGEEIERALGRGSLRGVGLDEALPPETFRLVRGRWEHVARDGYLVYMHGLIYKATDRYPIGGRLLLPLAEEEDGKVTGLLGMSDHKASSEPLPSGKSSLDIFYIRLSS